MAGFRSQSLLEELEEHPVTTLVGIASIALFVNSARLDGLDLQSFLGRFIASSARIWRDGEFYRFVTTTLCHVDILHLCFNLWFMWSLARVVERRLGVARSVAGFVLLAVVTTSSEIAFDNYGIGLSGVLFGVFGYLLVARHRDVEVASICHRRLVETVFLWFGLCFVLDATGLMRIGNLAHSSGLALGYLLGRARYDAAHRAAWTVGAALFSSAVVVAGSRIWALG